MVLVLQRRVLVMGPRIILRGAIPIDSNIGGSGQHPLLGEFVSHGWCLLSFFSLIRAELVFELPRVLARWCVHFLEGCIAKAVFLSCLRNVHFLGFMVLPWLATVLPLPARQ